MFTYLIHKLVTVKKGKSVYFSLVLAAFFVFSFFITVAPTFAMGSMTGSSVAGSSVDAKNMSPLMRLIEVDNPLYTPLNVTLDVLSIIIVLIAAFIIIKSIREYGKSTIGIALIYFFNATLVLGAIRMIFILDDDSLYSYANIKDITEMTAWHTLFYYAIILFYFAGRTLNKLVSSNKGKSSYAIAMFFLVFSVILSVIITVSMPFSPVQNFLESTLQNTWFNTFGWFHIIALLMAGGIALYLVSVKNKFKGYTWVIGDMSIALSLLAFIHLWELLGEGWHIIIVSRNFGEFVERCIWIPVFICILSSFIKLRRMAVSTPATNEADMSQSNTAPIVPVPSVVEPAPSIPQQIPKIPEAQEEPADKQL